MKDFSRQKASVTALREQLCQGIRDFPPSYFAMVMATGTLSIAAHLLSVSWLAEALFFLNVAMYLVLVLINIMRIICYPRRVFADMVSHQVGPGFFTFVASTSVLASQFILIYQQFNIAAAMLILAAVMWVSITYAIFTAWTIKENKPDLSNGISGAWLLSVVATQSVAVLTALMAAHLPQPYRVELNFVALSMWLWGGMLYTWMISLIFYRYTFFKFSPGDLSPPYWINMGAMAISTLAGTRLVQNSVDAPFLMSMLPFLKGATIFYWATGTWWIPMLVILGVWRHLYKRYPLQYDPQYWGAVFPLAMYTVCTYSLAKVMHLDFMMVIPRIFIYIALAAWMTTFVGLVRRLFLQFRFLTQPD